MNIIFSQLFDPQLAESEDVQPEDTEGRTDPQDFSQSYGKQTSPTGVLNPKPCLTSSAPGESKK